MRYISAKLSETYYYRYTWLCNAMDFKCSIPMQNKLVSSSFSEIEISTLDLKCNSQRDKHISEIMFVDHILDNGLRTMP